jgi:hypothetical protein
VKLAKVLLWCYKLIPNQISLINLKIFFIQIYYSCCKHNSFMTTVSKYEIIKWKKELDKQVIFYSFIH